MSDLEQLRDAIRSCFGSDGTMVDVNRLAAAIEIYVEARLQNVAGDLGELDAKIEQVRSNGRG